jgi:hypothetical protein
MRRLPSGLRGGFLLLNRPIARRTDFDLRVASMRQHLTEIAHNVGWKPPAEGICRWVRLSASQSALVTESNSKFKRLLA